MEEDHVKKWAQSNPIAFQDMFLELASPTTVKTWLERNLVPVPAQLAQLECKHTANRREKNPNGQYGNIFPFLDSTPLPSVGNNGSEVHTRSLGRSHVKTRAKKGTSSDRSLGLLEKRREMEAFFLLLKKLEEPQDIIHTISTFLNTLCAIISAEGCHIWLYSSSSSFYLLSSNKTATSAEPAEPNSRSGSIIARYTSLLSGASIQLPSEQTDHKEPASAPGSEIRNRSGSTLSENRNRAGSLGFASSSTRNRSLTQPICIHSFSHKFAAVQITPSFSTGSSASMPGSQSTSVSTPVVLSTSPPNLVSPSARRSGLFVKISNKGTETMVSSKPPLEIIDEVFQSREAVNIRYVPTDRRLSEADRQELTQSGIKDLLICPLFQQEGGEIIGVIQISNKKSESDFEGEDGTSEDQESIDYEDELRGKVKEGETEKNEYFDEEDIKKAHLFLPLVGIAVKNAKLYQEAVREYRNNSLLLQLSKNISEKLDVNDVIINITRSAKEVIQAERCSLFLIDEEKGELYSRVFENDACVGEIRFPIGKGIAGLVASTGEIINIDDAYQDERFNKEVDIQTGFLTRSILSIPIHCAGKIIGVMQVVNKQREESAIERNNANHGKFTDDDVDLFLAFAFFCGIALNKALLYENLYLSQQKLSLAVEMLSYHSHSSKEKAKNLSSKPLPSASELNMDQFDFYPLNFTEEQLAQVVLRMFVDLRFVEKYRIPFLHLTSFVLTVQKNYRDLPYHNFTHAVAVAHTMYLFIRHCNLERFLYPLEILALFVACLVHDIDHRGTNNNFQLKAATPLAHLHSTSFLEHHHFDQAISILHSPEHDIFQNLSSKDNETVLKNMQTYILSTDLAIHMPQLKKFKEVAVNKAFNKENTEHRKMASGLLISCCDLNGATKPWEVSKRVTDFVFEEFFMQGDAERRMGFEPQELYRREKSGNIAEMQLGFMEFICTPDYELLQLFLPETKLMWEGLQSNKLKWEKENNKLKWEKEKEKEKAK